MDTVFISQCVICLAFILSRVSSTHAIIHVVLLNFYLLTIESHLANLLKTNYSNLIIITSDTFIKGRQSICLCMLFVVMLCIRELTNSLQCANPMISW